MGRVFIFLTPVQVTKAAASPVKLSGSRCAVLRGLVQVCFILMAGYKECVCFNEG